MYCVLCAKLEDLTLDTFVFMSPESRDAGNRWLPVIGTRLVPPTHPHPQPSRTWLWGNQSSRLQAQNWVYPPITTYIYSDDIHQSYNNLLLPFYFGGNFQSDSPFKYDNYGSHSYQTFITKLSGNIFVHIIKIIKIKHLTYITQNSQGEF